MAGFARARAAARRAADQYRERMQADAEEIVARARSEAGQIRDQAAQELARLTGVQDSVRAELTRLASLLTQESAKAAPARA
ncbi:MAG: hypothetical protein JNM07_15025, partial [Phycisphaerae bacterium]|nr:hypothetical protein [Phycisphaerae bacterium]